MPSKSERTDRLPCPIDKKGLEGILRMKDLGSLVAFICSYKAEDAVAIVDNLDQLSAAIVVADLRILAHANSPTAQAIIKRAEELQIRGTAGLIYARDKVYHETGYFAGT